MGINIFYHGKHEEGKLHDSIVRNGKYNDALKKLACKSTKVVYSVASILEEIDSWGKADGEEG